MTKLKHVLNRGRIDLRGWVMPVADIFEVPLEKIEREIEKQIVVILEEAMKHGDITFPIEWNVGENPSDGRKGPPIDDPLLMYVTIPFDIDGHYPSWSFDLRDAVEMMLGVGADMDGNLEEENAVEVATKVRDGLRLLVERIDEVLYQTKKAKL